MRIARVIGSVTLSRAHETMVGLPLRLVEVVQGFDDQQQMVFDVEQVVTCDLLATGEGELIAMAEGPEAAQPFRPEIKPVDANSAAILDSLEV